MYYVIKHEMYFECLVHIFAHEQKRYIYRYICI